MLYNQIPQEKADREGQYYACIDLKSFYASVECADRGLDPFTTRLAVADPERESGTICLAITPAMKALGIKNRCRVFEIPKGIDYITAKPRMKRYIEKSADIYSIYLRYFSPDDIHVYSIDECFIDLTPYLKLYSSTPADLVRRVMREVLSETQIPATAGIGTNLFLAKVALDVTAKRASDGLGFLDRDAFMATVLHHRPITDIWQIGVGTARRLSHFGVYDLYGVTQLPESVLYREFGVNAEYLIDHANGLEPCTLADIKAYTPSTTSLTSGQVLFEPYSYDDALLILSEMVESLTLDLIRTHRAAGSVSLTVGYNREGRFNDPNSTRPSTGASERLHEYTNSLEQLTARFTEIYRKTTDPHTPIRRLNITLGDITDEACIRADMFTDTAALNRERRLLGAVVDIKDKYGKNAILRGISYEKKATMRARNLMIGGHNADVAEGVSPTPCREIAGNDSRNAEKDTPNTSNDTRNAGACTEGAKNNTQSSGGDKNG